MMMSLRAFMKESLRDWNAYVRLDYQDNEESKADSVAVKYSLHALTQTTVEHILNRIYIFSVMN